MLQGAAGFESARLLRRTTGDETEFVSLMCFDDLDAVRTLAGPDYETAGVAEDEARLVLARFDDHVGHYENGLGDVMISRIWHGYTRPGNADVYEALLDEIITGIEDRSINGFREIQVLRRDPRRGSGVHHGHVVRLVGRGPSVRR